MHSATGAARIEFPGSLAARWCIHGLKKILFGIATNIVRHAPSKTPTIAGGKPIAKLTSFVAALARAFLRSRGLLLASALAYNALLAILPLAALLMLGLSTLVDPARLRTVLDVRFRPFLPGRTDALPSIVGAFIEHRDVVGVATIALLLAFSVLGVRTVKQTLDIVFDMPAAARGERWFRRLVLEFAITLSVAVGVALLTGLALTLDALSPRQLELLGVPLAAVDELVFEIAAACGVALLLAVLYVSLAPRRVRWRVALPTAAFVTLSWQPIEALLAWFFEHISVVGVLYGSVAGLVIAMLSLEAGAILFVLGAQAIALSSRDA